MGLAAGFRLASGAGRDSGDRLDGFQNGSVGQALDRDVQVTRQAEAGVAVEFQGQTRRGGKVGLQSLPKPIAQHLQLFCFSGQVLHRQLDRPAKPNNLRHGQGSRPQPPFLATAV